MYVQSPMAVRTITITDSAYQSLARLKRENESFSDVVKRLTQKAHPLTEFAGAWKGVSPTKLREAKEFFEDSSRISADDLVEAVTGKRRRD